MSYVFLLTYHVFCFMSYNFCLFMTYDLFVMSSVFCPMYSKPPRLIYLYCTILPLSNPPVYIVITCKPIVCFKNSFEHEFTCWKKAALHWAKWALDQVFYQLHFTTTYFQLLTLGILIFTQHLSFGFLRKLWCFVIMSKYFISIFQITQLEAISILFWILVLWLTNII